MDETPAERAVRKELEQFRDENITLMETLDRENIAFNAKANYCLVLEERLEADRAVCLCGCPPDEHENYGEDGESCANPDHDCLRVCEAARAAHVALLERLEAAEEEVKRSHDAILALTGENERLASRLSDHKDAISQRDEIIRAQKDENERLRWEVEQGKDPSGPLAREQARRIEAALALCDSVDRPRGDRLVTIESVRKALKGKGER